MIIIRCGFNSISEATPLFIGVNVLLAEFYGKAAHAAGYPWDGRNALDGAVSCYNALSMLRQHLKPNCKVHGKGVQYTWVN